jgi:hypothetical protein
MPSSDVRSAAKTADTKSGRCRSRNGVRSGVERADSGIGAKGAPRSSSNRGYRPPKRSAAISDFAPRNGGVARRIFCAIATMQLDPGFLVKWPLPAQPRRPSGSQLRVSTLSCRSRERTAAGRCLEAFIDEYIARPSAAMTASRPPLASQRGRSHREADKPGPTLIA